MLVLLTVLSAQAQVHDAGVPWELPPLTEEVDLDPVVNGERARDGEWDDAVGIVMYGSYVGCTGTLIHPRIVLTADHCVGGISHVLVGSKDWTREGDMIAVDDVIPHPFGYDRGGHDIAVLMLEERVRDIEPRMIAQECLLDDHLDEGAEVAVVGFGSTRIDGEGGNTRLNQGVTFVQDTDGDEAYVDGIYTGFFPEISPGGEIGAGGNDVDSCFGDSGGPLYLLTDDAEYLIGVTSRSYAGVPWQEPCRYGGIYARPDAVIDWIEEVSGKKLDTPSCNDAPQASADPIFATSGSQGTSLVLAEDPDGSDAKITIGIAVDPAMGTVELQEDGTLVYTAPADFVGDDSFVVAVTDKGNSNRYPRSGQAITVEIEVPVTVTAPLSGTPGTTGTVPLESTGGCACDSGTSAMGWLLLAPLFLVRRR